jgi:hypothetical protein
LRFRMMIDHSDRAFFWKYGQCVHAARIAVK